MKTLERRLARLEDLIRADKADPYPDRPFTWERDWTTEELHLVVKYLRAGEPVPPELVEKAHLTRPSGRLAGLSPEEHAAILNELLDPDDDPADNLETFREEVLL
ncbi:MAG: hypothetical protein K6U74_04895 [Firmicutes bacterium]|nr:hypothetical protein [Bacillota bacterium]